MKKAARRPPRVVRLGSELERVLEDADHVRAVVVDPLAVVLADHVGGRVPHLVRDPFQGHRAGGEQLAGEPAALSRRCTARRR